MTVLERACPDCGERIAQCDNGVRLDVPAVAFDRDGACWTIMRLGHMDLAAAGGEPPPDGRGHTLHEHQPPETW
jgi:hypothetical protein